MPSNPLTPTPFTFENRATRLHAVEAGRGPAVVFLHGGLADHRSALYRVGSLSASCRVLAPDLRGSGRSVYAGPLSWELLADDVRALLDRCGLERSIVGGTSMGTAVAVAFARRHPQRVAGLLLVSPLYPGADRGLTQAQRTAMHAMADAGQRTLALGIEALLPLYETLPPELRERAFDMARGFDPGSVAATTRFLASDAQPFGSVSELCTLHAPTLVVPGIDPEHPPEVAALYARHLPNATLVPAAAPDFLERLARFCARVL